MSNGQLAAVTEADIRGRVCGGLEGLSDRELLTRFVSRRDGAAFRLLVERHGPMVSRVCRHVAGDAHAAEDAFQATFLVLVRRADVVEVRGSLAGWLCGVAYRTARRARADLARTRSREARGESMAAARPDFDAARDEIYRALHDEVARLPGPLRDPVVLCYLEGLTNDEAARRLGIPVGTIKTRLTKGRERLRSRLARRGLALSVLLLFVDLGRAKGATLERSSVDRAVAQALGDAPVAPRVAELAAKAIGGSTLRKLVLVLAILGGAGVAIRGACPPGRLLSHAAGGATAASCR